MVDSTIKAKLVRCPKCENLLAEPQDCSFFKCGGCGAILCAKNKKREADSVSDNSVEDKSKDTSLNFSLTEPSSHSETPLRHQENGDSDSSSGLDRLKKRSDFEGFRFSNSNYFPDSLSNEAIGQDRAGLVRKLDKLKDQFVESCNVVTEKAKEEAPLRFSSSGKHMSGPSYYHPEPEPPCSYNQAHVDPLRFQIHGRTPHQSHQFYSGQYIGNNNQVLFDTHLQNGMFHQPSCSCFRCYDQFRRVSGSMIHPTGLPDALHNPGFYHQERNLEFGTLHSPRTFTPPGPQSRGLHVHERWPSEFGDVQRTGLSRIRLSKGLSSSGCRQIHPLAGGAPFITCQNCFKLLKLPDKTDAATNKQRKLRCGACSCLIEYSIVDNKLIVSTDLTSASKPEIDWVAANFSSDDYDNAAYEFDPMDGGSGDVDTGSVSISDTAQEMQILDSTSASLSEDELSLDSPTVQPVSPDLLQQEHVVQDRSGAGSRSSRSEQDRFTVNKTVTRGNSMKESSVATEMDVSFNEYSQDSANDQGRTKKSGFASIVKKSLKDLTKSRDNDERGRSEFSINGHPVAERLVKTAEKQAGPIKPGNYWYDYRAGFWGVMGGPCLGILPPFIEELNYPMPENCAGGTTSVFVNGRELHQKDLRLLAARGLPRCRDRSYTVYITGRVIDEDTGEELNNLGKLAPTVDKLKRGFGMKVPRRAA